MGTLRATTAEFIEKAKKVHGDKYDYSLVEYLDNQTKVKIVCKTHGEFLQVPYSHCNGRGCPFCSNNNFKSNTQEFVKKAVQVHGDLYDYSKVDYSNNRSKVKIICRIHGEFLQTPVEHYRYGCNQCGYIKSGNAYKSSTQEFIKKAVQIHGDLYDYSKVDYVRSDSKVIIICKVHGEFLQTPCLHLKTRGCHECYYEFNKGVNHSCWNAELTDEHREKQRFLYLSELNAWRMSVFDRDQFTCKKCNAKSTGNIEAHHILPYALFPEVRTDISNGITLCKSCHAKYHSAYGKSGKCNHKTMDLYINAMA